MSNKIKIGDTIYVSKFGSRQFRIDCPVCFGKKVIGLILGNDNVVEMSCDYCRHEGLGSPATGYITEWRRDAGTEKVCISEIRSRQTAVGEEVEYLAGSRIYYMEDVFSTEAAALAESEHRATKYNLEQETKAEFVKGKPDKNYSWNAGYHMRAIKNANQKIEYHSKMAKICKARAKGKE